MIIKNRNDIGTTPVRRHALDIIEAGIERVLPCHLLESALKYDPATRSLTVWGDGFPLGAGRLFIIGGGKATGLMAESVEAIIDTDAVTAGLVVTKGGDYRTRCVEVITAGHPIPDERGAWAVSRMLKMKTERGIGKEDIVLCLISGGASALLPAPVSGVSLADKQLVTGLLIRSGADIAEINTVRKHLSRVKGGGLGRHFAPATIISLVISDVVGNDLSVIASGPTAVDPSTFADAIRILEKYGPYSRIPASVTSYLEGGLEGREEETPKYLPDCFNYIIGDNRTALEAMALKAMELGHRPCIVTSEQTGDTGEVAAARVAEIVAGKYAGSDVILIGGETTPRVLCNTGRGGRNQHFAATSLLTMAEYPGEWLAASVGTDGTDYLLEVVGALVDRESMAEIQARGIDIKPYLNNYDSNTLLGKIGHSLIVTGETGTNVGDVMVYILG